MWATGVVIVALICFHGGRSARLVPRMLFDPTGTGDGTSVFHQGGPMISPFHGGPGGDPTMQQHHSLESMMHGGSCLPLEQCACPNMAFRGPTGCYICNCDGSHGTDSGSVLPTPLIISAGTSKPTVNNQTPPTPPTSSSVTAAMTGNTSTAPSSSQCQSAAQLCLLNCPGGYLVDPNDCTFCVCKSSTLISGR